MRALTPKEVGEIRKDGLTIKGNLPVRFMHEGCAVDVITGIPNKKGINVMHQTVYWNLTRDAAKKVATLTGTKAVFSEE